MSPLNFLRRKIPPYVRIIPIGLIVVAFIFVSTLPFWLQAGPNDNISGWSWSENIGWFSLNSVNLPEGADYGLNLDFNTGAITGYAWSENTGWMAFGTTTQTAIPSVHGTGTTPASPRTPDGSAPTAQLQPNNQITGWARILNLWDYGYQQFGKNDWGWVKLNDPRWEGQGLFYNPDERQIGGFAWSYGGTIDGAGPFEGTYIPDAGYGWIQFSSDIVSAEEATIVGTVCVDQNDNDTCRDIPSETPLQDVLVFTTPGDYRDITNQNGTYTLDQLTVDRLTGETTYVVTAAPDDASTPEGDRVSCQSLTREVTVAPGDRVTLDFPLDCALAPLGTEHIDGYVYEDLNANNAFDADVDNRLAGALVYTDRGQSTFTDGRGYYIINNLVALQEYDIDAALANYQVDPDPPQTLINIRPTSQVNIRMEKTEFAGEVAVPWLQTSQGDIHSDQSLIAEAAPPTGYGNATYMITSNGLIRRFESWIQDYGSPLDQSRDWELANYRDFGTLPANLNGSPNIEGLALEATPLNNVLSPGDLVGSGVWIREDGFGNLDLNPGRFGPGPKTIIVRGNLNITNDFLYRTGGYADDQLPSVGFIVLGDVNIFGNVRRTVGAIYCLGTVNVFESRTRLIHEGLIIANDINFNRSISHDPAAGQYQPVIVDGQATGNSYENPIIGERFQASFHFDTAELESPSEIVFYDGRVAINTPPGFEDFTGSLPGIWREVAP